MTHKITLLLVETPGASQAALAGLAEMFAYVDRLHARAGLAPLVLAQCTPETLPDLPPAAVILPPAFDSTAYLTPPASLSGWLARLPDTTLVCSACAGAFHLGAAGLLDERHVTTHWALERRLAETCPRARVDTSECVLRDGRVITAGGLMSWTDLALELIGQFSTLEILRETGRYFVLNTGRRAQRPFRAFLPLDDHADTQIAAAQRLYEREFRAPPSLTETAARVGLSPRSFQRRFARATMMSPRSYLLALRVEAARRALETSQTRIEQIAFAVGYENTNAFRKVFQRHMGMSPAAYRTRLQR